MIMLADIETWIREYFEENSMNITPGVSGVKIFDLPLVGTALAADPLFALLKEPTVVGPAHLLPEDWLPGCQTVISYFLPFTEAIRSANRTPGDPALEWLYGRIEGQVFNNAISRMLADKLTSLGHQALIPAQDPRFTVVNRRSNWSERHVAFIAGLGTISLNRSLITRLGSAGRLGSVVTSLKLEATSRYYSDPEENCNRCGACIRRCPPQAIDFSGKNHAVCEAYLEGTKQRFHPRYGCGKCQTAVPCEKAIPARLRQPETEAGK